MKKTINQINQELKAIAEGMPQIHSYAWKDFLRAYKEVELNYPLMCCYYPSGALLDNQTDIQLTIVVADKIYKDWSNLNDVESDTLGICRSVFNIINRSTRWQRIGRVLSCNVTKFIERGGDEVAGHTMVFQFRLRDSNSLCDIPIFDYDFESMYESTCQPVLIFKDGILIDTVPSGGIYEYFSEVCLDATVENSDSSYSESVASGGTLVLPDITVTDSDGSTYTQPAVTDVVCTIPDPCEDSNLTLNGNAFLSVPSGDTQDIELLDQNGEPITPEDVTGNVITVDVGGGVPIGATLMKTGMITSNQTGDDAFDPQGRESDFFILGGLTPWGNNRRFSDELGNTSDSTAYYDINGGVIAPSSAYLSEVFIDWSTFNGTTYLMYYFGDMSGTLRNFTDYLSWCDGLSILGHTDWKALNVNELFNLQNPNRQGVTFYPPMSKKGIFGGFLWSNTSHKDTPTSAYMLVIYGGNIQEFGKTNTLYCMACRRGTLAEIGL